MCKIASSILTDDGLNDVLRLGIRGIGLGETSCGCERQRKISISEHASPIQSCHSRSWRGRKSTMSLLHSCLPGPEVVPHSSKWETVAREATTRPANAKNIRAENFVILVGNADSEQMNLQKCQSCLNVFYSSTVQNGFLPARGEGPGSHSFGNDENNTEMGLPKVHQFPYHKVECNCYMPNW